MAERDVKVEGREKGGLEEQRQKRARSVLVEEGQGEGIGMEMEAVTASLFSAADIALFRQMIGVEGEVVGGVESEIEAIAKEEKRKEAMDGVSANPTAADDDNNISPMAVAELEVEEGFVSYQIMDLNGLLYTDL